MDPEQLVDALSAFTDCEVTLTSRLIVIRDHRSVELTVSEVLRHHTEQLVALPQRELELKAQKLQDELHFRTLERIFIEERLYQRLETCKTNEAVFAAVYAGFRPFACELVRPLSETHVERLLQERIRRISLFDIARHRAELEPVKVELVETQRHLKNLAAYAIRHLEGLLEKYGLLHSRRPRSSRLGATHLQTEAAVREDFRKTIAYLRQLGFKRISFRTGSYGMEALAMALRYAAETELNLLNIDGSGGGTGMSPWNMMEH